MCAALSPGGGGRQSPQLRWQWRSSLRKAPCRPRDGRPRPAAHAASGQRVPCKAPQACTLVATWAVKVCGCQSTAPRLHTRAGRRDGAWPGGAGLVSKMDCLGLVRSHVGAAEKLRAHRSVSGDNAVCARSQTATRRCSGGLRRRIGIKSFLFATGPPNSKTGQRPSILATWPCQCRALTVHTPA